MMPPDAAIALFDAYTGEVLGWSLGGEGGERPPVEENSENAARAAERALRLHAAGKRSHMILLGAGDGSLAALLREKLPENQLLLVLETDVDAARRVRPRLKERRHTALGADSSFWALLSLVCGAGLEPERCTICRNPAVSGKEGEALRAWERLFTAGRFLPLPETRDAPPLSLLCMLHPEEPDLAEFFAHLPAWAHEVCVLWDGAPSVSGAAADTAARRCPAPLRMASRPLGAHFGEQRNALLALCRTDWCLYLDADERFAERDWSIVRRLPALPGAGGALFPRWTFEGDENHVRMGRGLWPDVQLRLFRRAPGLRFEGAVHESLTGLEGHLVLAASPILHYSHVRKAGADLARRLEIFDQAAGEARHRLSAEYPRLPVAFFQKLRGDSEERLFLLPPSLG